MLWLVAEGNPKNGNGSCVGDVELFLKGKVVQKKCMGAVNAKVATAIERWQADGRKLLKINKLFVMLWSW